MTTPPSSPPPPLTDATSHSPSTLKRTRKATRLRSLATRPIRAERPLVHVDPATGKADGTHRKKLRTYLGIVARNKVDVTYKNWKQVPATQKDLIWEDIQVEFDIPEASDLRTKKIILQTVGERWRQFKSNLTLKWALAADKDVVDDTVCEKYDISKEKWTQFCQSRRDPSRKAIQNQNVAPHVLSHGGYEFFEKKLMDEKKKKQLEEASQSRSTNTVIDPPSPIRRHVKWKMTHTKEIGQMTSEAAKEITDKIVVSNAAIGRLEHPSRVYVAGAGVMIKQYFGPAPRTSCTSSSMALEDLEQLMQKIRDQLEESIIKSDSTNDVSQFQSQMQSQGLALPLEPKVGPSAAYVSTKESCVDPLGNNPDTGDSEKYGLYVEENPPRLVARGRLYEGSIIVHNIPLLHDQVMGAVGSEKPTDRLNRNVMWDATVFGLFNDDFPLYIKQEDMFEITHGVHIDKWSSFCLRKMLSFGFVCCIIGQKTTPKGIINRNINILIVQYASMFVLNNALKGLDDTPQSKSKAAARWIVVKCSNDARPLELERLKALRIYSHTSTSMTPEELKQLTQKIRNQLEESIIEKIQSQGLVLLTEPEVGPFVSRDSTKGSCVDPSGQDPDMGESDKCGLYVDDNPPRLVALGRVYEESTTVHNVPLGNNQVKVVVEEVQDANAYILVHTQEDKQGAEGLAKPVDRSEPDDDPLYQMALTILQLFLKTLQVSWDATMFGVYNDNFPLHMSETSMRARNVSLYEFLEPYSIQSFGQSQFELEDYIKK
ncbi:hypothetical protein HKD37_09G024866 [Glycine soja]